MRPLPTFPFPPPVAVEPPEGWTLVPAVPGSPGVVLAFERPPFLCDAAPVASLGLERATADAIAGNPSWTVLDGLRAQFGPEVREVFDGVHFA